MIMMMAAPGLGFRFGYDPEKRAVFVVANDKQPFHEQIAANVTSGEVAKLVVEMWCRGWRSRDRQLRQAPGTKSFQIMTETGHLGIEVPPLNVGTARVEG